MFNKDDVNGSFKNKFNREINPHNLLDTTTLCANEEVHSGKFSASPMSSGERKKKDDTNDTPNNEVATIYHNPSKYNDNPGMGEKSKWKMAPQLIISAVISKTQDDLPIEEITFPSDMPTEEPTSALASEQNDYSLSGYPS